MLKKLIKWFDNDSVNIEADSTALHADWRQIDVWRVVPFVLLHLACLCVFWVGFSWFALIFAVVLYKKDRKKWRKNERLNLKLKAMYNH